VSESIKVDGVAKASKLPGPEEILKIFGEEVDFPYKAKSSPTSGKTPSPVGEVSLSPPPGPLPGGRGLFSPERLSELPEPATRMIYVTN
jgi:hypothetical protein